MQGDGRGAGLVATRKLRSVVRIAEAAGLAREALLASAGLTAADLANEDGYLPLARWRDLWVTVHEQTGDGALGLRAGQQIDRGYFGVIDYLVRSSPNMEAAVHIAIRHFRLANTEGTLELTDEGAQVGVIRRIRGDEGGLLPPQVAEFSLTAMVQLFRHACAASWRLARATFRHPQPSYAAEHRRFFDCPVYFGADHDALYIPREVLALPMRSPDPTLRHLVEQHAEQLLAALPQNTGIVTQVQRALTERLPYGESNAGAIATRLGLSRRTLQRQLKQAGTSFRDVLVGLRRGLAEQYLRHSDISSGEVALLLGYADVTSFHRAFRGWTGQTPGAFRQ